MPADPCPPVLVATDLSPGGDDAIRAADRRARELGARLAVCLALPDPLPSASLFPPAQYAVDLALPSLRRQAIETLGTRVEALTGRPPGEVEIAVPIGTPHVEIVGLAERLAARLLVVGRRGTAGPTHTQLGSVAERVLRHAPCPVLVAQPPRPTGRILVATDFSESAGAAVAEAAAEAKRHRCELTILHSVELMFVPVALDGGMAVEFSREAAAPDLRRRIDREVYQRLAASLAAHEVTGDRIVRHGPASATIVDTALAIEADLLVVGTIGRSGRAQFLIGSTAEGVARRAPCSMLVVRHPAPARTDTVPWYCDGLDAPSPEGLSAAHS